MVDGSRAMRERDTTDRGRDRASSRDRNLNCDNRGDDPRPKGTIFPALVL
tara:strand:+ start:232 stop:381 length:150 start_codon:yes stop_codon:yes gene_type:complete